MARTPRGTTKAVRLVAFVSPAVLELMTAEAARRQISLGVLIEHLWDDRNPAPNGSIDLNEVIERATEVARATTGTPHFWMLDGDGKSRCKRCWALESDQNRGSRCPGRAK